MHHDYVPALSIFSVSAGVNIKSLQPLVFSEGLMVLTGTMLQQSTTTTAVNVIQNF